MTSILHQPENSRIFLLITHTTFIHQKPVVKRYYFMIQQTSLFGLFYSLNLVYM